MNASAEKIWGNCLFFIKDNIQQQAFKTWFEPIIPLKLTENSLSIQVPSNGKPIVLMRDIPCTGGYPKIAILSSEDISKIAQLLPGTFINFNLERQSI